MNRPPPRKRLDQRLVATVCKRLAADQRVRRTLPGSGRISIDRQVPFLVVHRPPPRPDGGTSQLVVGEAAYLIAPAARRSPVHLHDLLLGVVGTLSEVFGGFLVIELWSAPERTAGGGEGPPPPAFRLVVARPLAETPSVEQFARSLRQIRLSGLSSQVSLNAGGRVAPPGFAPLLSPAEARRLRCHLIGLEISPVYQDPATGSEYPLLRRALHHQLAIALRRTGFVFARQETEHRPRHFQALGRRAFVKAAWEVDRKLAGIASGFDLILTVTPANTDAEYRAYRRRGRRPRFFYRPHEVDPSALKRQLYSIPVEHVEDPTLLALFVEKRRELDLKLSLLAERGTTGFLPLSVALYGNVGAELHEQAKYVLDAMPARGERRGQRLVGAEAFAERARAELARYRSTLPQLTSTVEMRSDTATLMVSQGNLLVGRSMSFPARRVEALIQHEVGTHILTFANGKAQPFRLLASGLASYDELQEGLGVFAEYLTGGLTSARLRTLAARVIAARSVLDGADFTETFRHLRDGYDFEHRAAFMITMRVHRSGGLVKDAIYLRGLRTVMDYVRDGGQVESLLVGKIAADHVPIIEELRRREVLRPMPLRPAYLDDPGVDGRLAAIRDGMTVADLAATTLRPPRRAARPLTSGH